jgi:hypothetical protein
MYSINILVHFAECSYAKCHYNECHDTECRGAIESTHINELHYILLAILEFCEALFFKVIKATM